MVKTAAIIIHITVIFVTLLVIGLAYRRDRQRPLIRVFLLMGAMFVGWAFTSMLTFFRETSKLACYFHGTRFVFVGFSILGLLIFVLYFYRLDHYARPQVIGVFSIFPLITTVLAVTNPWHNLMGTFPAGAPQGSGEQGIWFWVHAAYSYLLVFVSALVAITQHMKLPKTRRLPSVFILGGIAVTILCHLSTLIGSVSLAFSLTPVSTGTSFFLFYLALCNCSKMDILMLARNEIFHLIDDSVFVLDTEGKMMDINQSGRKWLVQLGITGPVTTFRDITRHLEDSGAEFRRLEDREPGTDVTVTSPQGTSVYNIREKQIIGEDGYELGMFVTCSDVTRNRQLINRLEETMEVDALTGLQNRWGLYRMFSRVAEEQILPVTLIMGDVNGLKAINDSCGHQKGDQLLRDAARVLKESCPPKGEAFRVGGDEFVILLPGYEGHHAEKIIRDIHQHLDSIHHYPFPISISLGLATDTRYVSSLEDLMRRADDHMYRSKRILQRKPSPHKNSLRA